MGFVFDLPAEGFDLLAQGVALREVFGLARGGALVDEGLDFGGNGGGEFAQAEDFVEGGVGGFEVAGLRGGELAGVEELVGFADELE